MHTSALITPQLATTDVIDLLSPITDALYLLTHVAIFHRFGSNFLFQDTLNLRLSQQ
jgi:hypothetical protein